MTLGEYMNDPRTQVSFKTAWIHLVVQIAASYMLLEKEIIYLFVFITSFPGIFYFVFQFPITGLLIRQTQDIVHRKFHPRQVLPKFLVSALLFALFGCGIALLLLVPASIVNADEGKTVAEVILQNFTIVFKYFCPMLFTGELIRQRLFFKKIYGQTS